MDYLNHETILVGGLEHFFSILGIIIPTDYIIFFRGVETTNQNTIDWLLQRISPIAWWISGDYELTRLSTVERGINEPVSISSMIIDTRDYYIIRY